MTNSIPTDEQIKSGTSFLRNTPLDDVQAANIVVVVRGERYVLDLNTLNYWDRTAAAEQLGPNAGPLGLELMSGNELAAYVAAYLAVRRVHAQTTFDDIAVLTVRDLDVILLGAAEDTAPLDDDSSTSSGSATTASEPTPEHSSRADSPTDD
jgi:hypothetical protein